MLISNNDWLNYATSNTRLNTFKTLEYHVGEQDNLGVSSFILRKSVYCNLKALGKFKLQPCWLYYNIISYKVMVKTG